jgi:hypothetical protein
MRRRINMTGSKNGPFLNEDAVVAIGLAFAGMAVLQSKLFPAFSSLSEAALGGLLDWKVLEWWPVLLIAAGIGLWLKDKRRKHVASSSQSGGGK